MSLFGQIVRNIKEAPLLNEMYRHYTEYKVARSYQGRNTNDVFTEINVGNKWAGKESVSGPGSDFIQTQIIIQEIPALLRKLNVKNFLDLPCGDHNWMKEADLKGINYIGGDIVKHLAELNNKRFGSAHKRFVEIDLLKDELLNADLVLVRDCLVHLSFKKINQALANLKRSNIQYILTTNFPKTRRNYDITIGNWRPLNLLKSPFNFPAPLKIIVEGCTESYGQYPDKSLGLWEIGSLPESLNYSLQS